MSPNATSTGFFNPSKDGDSTTALGSLVQCLTTLSLDISPNIQPKPPLMQLEAIASRPKMGTWAQQAAFVEVNCRIIESLRLEKTSKIIKSNCRPNTPMPVESCPEVPHLHVF